MKRIIKKNKPANYKSKPHVVNILSKAVEKVNSQKIFEKHIKLLNFLRSFLLFLQNYLQAILFRI